jgi:hypothetical protein
MDHKLAVEPTLYSTNVPSRTLDPFHQKARERERIEALNKHHEGIGELVRKLMDDKLEPVLHILEALTSRVERLEDRAM